MARLLAIDATIHNTYSQRFQTGPYGLNVYDVSKQILQESSKITRSKQDSEHIIGLRVEISLLKTFIMESYNNLTNLSRAEQLTEAEEQYRSTSRRNTNTATHHPSDDGCLLLQDPKGGSSLHEPRIMRSPASASKDSKFEKEDSNLGSETDDGKDNHDIDEDHRDEDEDKANNDSHISKNQNDRDGAKAAGDSSNEEELVSNFSFQPQSALIDRIGSTRRRESDFLLQMVPYRPRPLHQINSDRLIPYRQDSDSDIENLSCGATHIVRLLLDKWTNSGSTTVSDVPKEEATKERLELLVGGPPCLRKIC